MIQFQSEAYIRLLLRFTKTQSEMQILAVIDHMLNGLTQQECVEKYGIAQSALSMKKKRILELDDLVKQAIKINQRD
ncbi:PapB/FocB family fimbrial expression transcriptional regulator [Aeromonas salmonicida]|uniref:PapB/FocB family fimbrial expression transcriptional regulator n=1 Tax=Aeromonas salmonicida TaxID=645 RepID=UPI000B402912|nr:PapB/FocB family fimbrial expression transcriptional regulator [Aeromonas salmonicida]ARW85308.1 hypothetical protein O23A_P3p0009 [Aeromonas salmonicida]